MLKEVENYEDNTESMALEQTRNAIQKLRDERERMWNEEQEALDKINEKEQRRLDIVKARIDLENAKKNRNQLVFANGSYYYDYDQEALRNAEEKFSNAVKADEDANREEAKEADLKVYDTIIDALDELGDDSVSAIDTKTLSDALSDYKDDGKISDDNLAEMQKILGEDSELLKGMKDGTLSMDADQIREIVRGMVTSDISQSVVSTEEQEKINQAVSEVANNIYDNSITIGNIVNNVTMPEGTTQQQVQTLIDGFASELIDHLHSLSTKIN
jgi:membrane-associated HD superfamily phosphohydrolase